MTIASWAVVSSSSCFIVTPSMMSTNFTRPAFSERMGTLYGSHCTNGSPFLTLPPFLTEMTEPMTRLCASNSRPPSSARIEMEPFLFKTMLLPSSSSTSANFVVTNDAVELGLDLRLLENLRGRAADVEGAHGQLRAGLADGLGGDDADRFAALDHAAGGQVAPVAAGANAVLALASQHRADADAFDAAGFQSRWP